MIIFHRIVLSNMTDHELHATLVLSNMMDHELLYDNHSQIRIIEYDGSRIII